MRPIDKLGFGPTYAVHQLSDEQWRITVVPPAWAAVGNGASIVLNADQYRRFLKWRDSDGLIQNELPELSKGEREILMTGIGPDTWNKSFPEDP
jgi:hypothetical protein